MISTEADRDAVRRLEGLFVGQLTREEMESFRRCLHDGFARESYEGTLGFMGLAKVRMQ